MDCANDHDHTWRRLGDGWMRCVRCGAEMDEATLVIADLA